MPTRYLQLRMNTLLYFRHIHTHTQSIVKKKKNLRALLVPFGRSVSAQAEKVSNHYAQLGQQNTGQI